MTNPPRKVRVACSGCGHTADRTQRAGALKSLEELQRNGRCGQCHARASSGLVTFEAIAPPPPFHFTPREQRTRRVRPAPTPVFAPYPIDVANGVYPTVLGQRRRAMVNLDYASVVAGIGVALAAALAVGASILGLGAAVGQVIDARAADERMRRAPYLIAAPGEEREALRAEFCETRLHWIANGGGWATGADLDQLIGHCPNHTRQIADVRSGEAWRFPDQ